MHTMEYYLAVKRNEVLTPATTQMNLGNTVPSGRSQLIREHTVYACVYMTCPEQANPQRQKVCFRLPEAAGKWGWGGTAKRYRVSLDDGNAPQFNRCDGFTTVNGLKTIELHTLKRMGCFDV